MTGAFVSLAPKSNPASPTQPRKPVLKSSYSAPVSPKLARTSFSVQQRVASFESLTRTLSQVKSLPLLGENAAKQASSDKAHCTRQTLKKGLCSPLALQSDSIKRRRRRNRIKVVLESIVTMA